MKTPTVLITLGNGASLVILNDHSLAIENRVFRVDLGPTTAENIDGIIECLNQMRTFI